MPASDEGSCSSECSETADRPIVSQLPCLALLRACRALLSTTTEEWAVREQMLPTPTCLRLTLTRASPRGGSRRPKGVSCGWTPSGGCSMAASAGACAATAAAVWPSTLMSASARTCTPCTSPLRGAVLAGAAWQLGLCG